MELLSSVLFQPAFLKAICYKMGSIFNLESSEHINVYRIYGFFAIPKLTTELDCIGFDHSLYALELGDVILLLIGFEKRGDDLWD